MVCNLKNKFDSKLDAAVHHIFTQTELSQRRPYYWPDSIREKNRLIHHHSLHKIFFRPIFLVQFLDRNKFLLVLKQQPSEFMAAQNFKICILANQQILNNLELEIKSS